MAERTILITGGGGMLAARLMAHFSAQPHTTVLAPARAELDITDEAAVLAAVRELAPTAVINTAALLVEQSEADPREAFRINAWGPRNLALACAENDAALAHISTGGLFGDAVRSYNEYDPVVLKTQYAKSKFAGEEQVRSICPWHFILRLGWLYGGGRSGRRDFVAARLEEARGKDVLQCAGDKFGSPVGADEVATLLDRLFDAGSFGLYHVAGADGCSRAEYVAAILEAAGSPCRVEAVDSGAFPRKADVPACEILESWNLGYAGVAPLPHWKEGLTAYVRALTGGRG